MQKMGTLIRFPSRAKIEARKKSRSKKETTEDKAAIVDMTERRDAMLMDERRTVKRTLLTEFIGASVVVPGKGLERVSIYDISDGGLAFDMNNASGHFRTGDEVAVRIYLNHQTYFTFLVQVANVREFPEQMVFRHGTGFVPESMNLEAVYHFVRFIETVSASLKTDSGDVLVSSLR